MSDYGDESTEDLLDEVQRMTVKIVEAAGKPLFHDLVYIRLRVRAEILRRCNTGVTNGRETTSQEATR